MDVACREMSPRVLGIALDCSLRHRASSAEGVTRIRPSELNERCVRPREQAVGSGILGIDVDGLFQNAWAISISCADPQSHT